MFSQRWFLPAVILLICSQLPQNALGVSFDWAVIGNPGNADDSRTIRGGVDYSYRISKHEVTNAQYVDFLNAVASTDTNSLYSTAMETSPRGGIIRSGLPGSFHYSVKQDAIGVLPNGDNYSYASKPVVYVSFFDAMRFVNWLNNGQSQGTQDTSTTESGAYEISNGVSESRASSARYWIPSEDEWYKAAYHDSSAGTAGIYFDYATRSDIKPDNNMPSADSGNSANSLDSDTPNIPLESRYTNGTSIYPMTDVGSYADSESPYGTFDQNGNVWEWNERRSGLSNRIVRGGAWEPFPFGADNLRKTNRQPVGPTGLSDDIGFRVAAVVPEPCSLFIAIAAGCVLLLCRHPVQSNF